MLTASHLKSFVRSPENIVGSVLFLFAIALSVKYFSGLENSDYYAGFTLKTLYPDLYPTDPVLADSTSGMHQPYRMSLYYLFPMIFGEIWLDDRFVAFFYVASVFATFLAADRIAVVLGAKGIIERLLIQLMFLKDHKIIANLVLFAYHPDFNHSALSCPFALWLLYAALAEKPLWIVLVISVILVGISPQVGPFVTLLGLLIVAMTGAPADRRWAAGLIGLGVIAAYVVLFYIADVPERDRLFLWEPLVQSWYRNMANPFNTVRDGYWSTVRQNLVLLGLFIAAGLAVWRGPLARRTAARGCLAIIGLGLACWLMAGLYVSFAPDFMKWPQLLLFPYARQLQFPQIIVYILLMVFLLRLADRGGAAWGWSGFGFFILFIIGPGNYVNWAVLFAVSLAAGVAVYTLGRNRVELFRMTSAFRGVLFLALVGTFGTAMAVSTWQKAPAWIFLAKTGIYGESNNAKWLGVDRYLRNHSPNDAVILPLNYKRPESASEQATPSLEARRNLASRSGRAIVVPFLLARGLDRDNFELTLHSRPLTREIADAWLSGDHQAVARKVEALRPRVTHIVVPEALTEKGMSKDLPFAKQATLNGFSVLVRR